MQHVGRVDVFEAAQDLVQEVADVLGRQRLCAQQTMHVHFHELLDQVDLVECFQRAGQHKFVDPDNLQREKERERERGREEW